MDPHAVADLVETMAAFGGIALVIWVSMQGKIAHIKAEAQTRRQQAVPPQVEDGAVLAELKALKQQMAEMHSTSHQFDISFDEALNRLEGRVSRIETKSATRPIAPDAPVPVQRNGQHG